MIDPKLLRTDPDRIRRSQQARGESLALVDDLVAADGNRRAAIATYESLRAEQKGIGKQVATSQGEARQELLARTR
ncbi:MAG: serine--tRNA ligase, partial [Propionicimonas sp.]